MHYKQDWIGHCNFKNGNSFGTNGIWVQNFKPLQCKELSQ